VKNYSVLQGAVKAPLCLDKHHCSWINEQKNGSQIDSNRVLRMPADRLRVEEHLDAPVATHAQREARGDPQPAGN